MPIASLHNEAAVVVEDVPSHFSADQVETFFSFPNAAITHRPLHSNPIRKQLQQLETGGRESVIVSIVRAD